jgi:AcrR family transcriptional regulator
MDDALMPADDGSTDTIRRRIVQAAAHLIAAGGVDAATTRAVSAAAAVQAPTIYRLFGDKRGLLNAVAEQGLAAYVADKAQQVPHPDPVQDLRDGWDTHVVFGLAHPGLFAILTSDPHHGPPSPAMLAGAQVLHRRIRAIAQAGRLAVPESRALALLQSMGTGTVLTLLGQPPDQRDPELSVAAREAVIATMTCAAQPVAAGAAAAAITLRGHLDDVTGLSVGERALLTEWLDRIADQG